MSLNCKVQGEGKPLLILHGFLGSLDNWQGIARELAVHRQVVSVDLRNHGRSPHLPDMTYASMVTDLAVLRESLGLEQFDLLGHSMGGKVAMGFALTHPGNTDRLVVVDMAPRIYLPGHEAVLNALSQVELERLQNRQEAADCLGNFLEDPAMVAFLLKNLHREQDGTYRWKMNLPLLRKEYARILEFPFQGQFPGSTLFLRGGQSDYIRPGDEGLLGRYFPAYRLRTLEGAGHWVHAEQPAAFLEEVKAFLG